MGGKAKGCGIAVCILVGLIALVVLAGYLYDLHWHHKVEAKLAEYRAAGQPVTWDDVLARRPKIPDDQNAALVLLGAFKQFAKTSDYESGLGDLWRRGRPGARHSEQLRGLMGSQLEADSEALRLIHDAAKLDRGCYPLDTAGTPYELLLPHLPPLRHGTYFCGVEARFLAENGKAKESARVLDDAHILPASIGDSPLTIEALVRIAAERIWLASIESTLAVCEMGGDDVRLLRLRLEREMRDFSMVPAMFSSRAGYQWLFQSRSVEALDDLMSVKPDSEFKQHLIFRVYFTLPGWREKDALSMYDALTRAASAVGKPPRQAFREIQAWHSDLGRDRVQSPYSHLVTTIIAPGISRALQECIKARTELEVGRTGLAVEEWRLRHGRWPDSLEQLVPEVLDAVPDDPFSDSPIRSAKTPDGVVVYSVGEDGTDNGGIREEEARKRAGKEGDWLRAGWDIPFRLLNPDLRGAETLSFHDEVMESGMQSSALEAAGLTKEKLSALGLSAEDLAKLGFE